MSNIKLLDQNTINKIAAGEVVERPAAVVKELIENAIDAGANAITTEIKEGGTSFIRITDNGNGIMKDDIKTAFLRHATSKIKSIEDLLSVSSLGFRGEALASIASVAQVELVTKTSNELTGIRYIIEGGEEKSYEEIGCPNGTTFLVRNLFFNTPARRKFLKSPNTEASLIGDLITRLSVSHPDISFKFINNNKIKVHTSGNGKLKDIVYNVYGRDISSNLLEVKGGTEQFDITGYIGKPVVTRGNRDYENYFINGRYVKSSIISKAIEEAFKPYIMLHRYPFAALHFRIDSDLIDVNVHPTKMEIRFKNSNEIYHFTNTILSQILSGKELIPSVSLVEEKEEQPKILKAPEPFEENRRKELNQSEGGRVINSNHRNTPQSTLNLSTGTSTIYIAKEENKKENPLTLNYKKEIIDKTEIGKLEKVIANPELLREESNYHKKLTNESDTDYNNGNKTTESFHKEESIKKDYSLDRNTDSISKDNIGKQNSKEQDYDDYKPQVKIEELSIDETESDQKDKGLRETEVVQKESEEAQKETEKVLAGEQISIFEDKLLSKEAKARHRIVGEVFGTYWIVEYMDKMFMIDQHAAHEKVLYEKTLKAAKEKEYLSQIMNPPFIVTLNMREEEALKTHQNVLSRLGFEIEHFGGKEYSVRALPSNLYGIASEDFLIELIANLVDEVPVGTSDMILEKVASLSCKAAVKGNTRMSYEEAHALIDQLLELDNPYNCPHGRPVIISMSKYEIEKKFKRIV
jgi:DNA mismatch repair protein MutL